MTLIFGGAYQGKLSYALEHYCLDNHQVHYCTDQDTMLDTEKKIITGLHLYILALIKTEEDPVANIKALYPHWQGKIILCDDISSGVVPIDPALRAWREAVGRCLALLAQEADEVVRMFCGIGQRIK